MMQVGSGAGGRYRLDHLKWRTFGYTYVQQYCRQGLLMMMMMNNKLKLKQ